MTAPPKPAIIDAAHAPDGVEVKFVPHWASRPLLSSPLRSALVHTNGANGEGSIESAWNWALADTSQNTCPHYQVDRSGRARKMLPSDRKAIGNGTVGPSNPNWVKLTPQERAEISEHGFMSSWSLVIETADLGYGPGKPGEACGFTPEQGEVVAQILAFESLVSASLPVRLLPEWWGAGMAAHTDPFGFPFTTTARGKVCPGAQKKREVRDWILPRASELRSAWTAAPVVVDPPIVVTPIPRPVDPVDPPTSEEDDMIIVDYGKPGTDWWWTRCVIAGGTIAWVQGKAQQWTEPGSTAPRTLDELATRHIQVENDQHFADLLATYKATSACPSTFAQNPGLTDAWAASLAR